MEWWYKSERFPVSADNADKLEDGMKTVMRQGNNLSTANLYSDDQAFYIKTTNHFSLNYFLNENGFEALEDGKPAGDLKLVFGAA